MSLVCPMKLCLGDTVATVSLSWGGAGDPSLLWRYELGKRRLTEADIVNFACLSGDHFYAHMDKIAAAESIFGERVVHGYFLISAAAGLFVDAGVGPVIANYGMENLRFIEPVKPGDTIQVRLTCKRKTVKRQRNAEEKATGVVEWSVEIFNQHQQAVALYSILTLVARQQGDFPA